LTPAQRDQDYNIYKDGNAVVIVSNTWINNDAYQGSNNIIGLDPVFSTYPELPSGSSELMLHQSSPCINRGNNDVVRSLINTDITGVNPRIYNSESGGIVDMGAFESTYSLVNIYTLQVTQEGQGVLYAFPTSVMHGVANTIIAYAADHWHFSGWQVVSGTGVSFGNPSAPVTTVTLTGGDAAIKAVFLPNP